MTSQSTVKIYTTSYCPYCIKAKQLFDKKGVTYQEIDVEQNESLRDFMIQKAGGRRTVPQIFISDIHIGGYDDLYALEVKGELDPLLHQ